MTDDDSAMIRIFADHRARRAYVAAATPGVIGPPLPPVEAADIPRLLVQTVVRRGNRTSEGTLIEAVTLPWFKIIEYLKTDLNVAYQIPPDKWEEIIAGAYKEAGFEEVTLTLRSRDHRRDVIAIKRGIGFIRVIDQVKAYRPPHLVDTNDVRALMGVLGGDGASKGYLSTTSEFAPMIRTDPLITPFIPSKLELINGTALFSRLQELAAKRKS